jgi:hypothetical protein
MQHVFGVFILQSPVANHDEPRSVKVTQPRVSVEVANIVLLFQRLPSTPTILPYRLLFAVAQCPEISLSFLPIIDFLSLHLDAFLTHQFS